MDTRSCTDAPGSVETALDRDMDDGIDFWLASDCSNESRGMVSSSDDTESASPIVTGARVEAFFGWMRIGGALL